MKDNTFYAFTSDVPAPEAVRRFVERFGVEPGAIWVRPGTDVAALPVVDGLPVVEDEAVPGFALYLAFPLSQEKERGVA